MLDNVDAERGERFAGGDAYDVILFICFLQTLDDEGFVDRSKYQWSWWQHDQSYKSEFRMLKLTILNH